MTLERIEQLVRVLNSLLEDPQPRLASWCLSLGEVMTQLSEEWKGENR
jgi:hypothetical protein